MKKRMLLFLTCLTFSFQTVVAQVNKQQLDTFLYKPFIKSLRIPRAIFEDCKSSFLSIIIRVRDNKVSDELYFSTNTPALLRKEIEKQKPLFKSTDWVKIFPDIGNKRDYNLFIPFIYFMRANCYEKIPSYNFSEIIKGAFSFDKNSSQATYILEPLLYELSKPVQ